MKNPIIAVITSILLVGCASMPQATDSVSEADTGRDPASQAEANTREPASMTGNHEWLNDVQDDFSRIADETSSRSVASRRPDVLVSKSRWSFNYLPANNQFSLKLDGTNFGMVQTNLDDQNMFAFAAEGQTETPITLTVAKNDGREIAEASGACAVELSFWDTKNKKYQKDTTSIRGERCERVIEQLRSYVP